MPDMNLIYYVLLLLGLFFPTVLVCLLNCVTSCLLYSSTWGLVNVTLVSHMMLKASSVNDGEWTIQLQYIASPTEKVRMSLWTQHPGLNSKCENSASWPGLCFASMLLQLTTNLEICLKRHRQQTHSIGLSSFFTCMLHMFLAIFTFDAC